MEFEEDFENDVVALPFDNTTSSTKAKYLEFIDKYGTSYINRIVLGGRAKKLKWLSSSLPFTPNLNKNTFLSEITPEPLLFDGGDADLIAADLSGNINQYNIWYQTLSENPVTLEITTEKISKTLTVDNFPFDKNIEYKSMLL